MFWQNTKLTFQRLSFTDLRCLLIIDMPMLCYLCESELLIEAAVIMIITIMI